MKYKTFNNQNGVLTECIKCQNEEIVKDAEYCHICGSPLINKCSNEDDCRSKSADKPIPINARYCPYCASFTTFKINNMLEHWEDEKIEMEIPF